MTHFMEVVASFLNYKNDCEFEIIRMQYGYDQLSQNQKSMLKYSFDSKISQYREAVDNNYIVLCKAVKDYGRIFNLAFNEELQQFIVPPTMFRTSTMNKQKV